MSLIYTQQASNSWKTVMLMVTFFGLVIGLGWIVSYSFGNPSILVGFVIFSIVLNIVSYWKSDQIVLRMSHAKQVTRQEMPDLWNITENLSITAGLPMPKLYIMDDPSPNAFATGRNKEHGVVCVSTGLVHLLDKNELEGVIAHELSHIGNKDILIGTVAVILAGFVSIVADVFLRSALFGMGDSDSKNPAILLIGVGVSILAPLFATLLRLAVSRKREYLADASAALLTRYPEALASALEKISTNTQPLKHAHKATAHLFISNPFGKKKKRMFSRVRKLFSTHPPIQERIRILREMDL